MNSASGRTRFFSKLRGLGTEAKMRSSLIALEGLFGICEKEWILALCWECRGGTTWNEIRESWHRKECLGATGCAEIWGGEKRSVGETSLGVVLYRVSAGMSLSRA